MRVRRTAEDVAVGRQNGVRPGIETDRGAHVPRDLARIGDPEGERYEITCGDRARGVDELEPRRCRRRHGDAHDPPLAGVGRGRDLAIDAVTGLHGDKLVFAGPVGGHPSVGRNGDPLG